MSSACVQVKESLRPRASQRKLPRGVQPGSETAAATFDVVDVEGEEEYCFVVETSAAEGVEPQSLAEARRLPEWSEWEKAIKEELDTLERAGTYVEAEAPAGREHRWVEVGVQDQARR